MIVRVRFLTLLSLLFASFVAHANLVTNVTLRQLKPWNFLVEIEYAITKDLSKNKMLATEVSICDHETGLKYSAKAFTHQPTYEKGLHRLIWEANNDGVAFKSTNVTVAVSVVALVNKVQLWENGPYWASCNIGATEPEHVGYYFWWGDTVGYVRNVNNDGWVASDGSGRTWRFDETKTPTYGMSDGELVSMGYTDDPFGGMLNAAHDAATQHWGADWRMPTASEARELFDNCTTVWTNRNGVWGCLATGKGFYSSKSIFLPAGGMGHGALLRELSSCGQYWTSESYEYNSHSSYNLITSGHTWSWGVGPGGREYGGLIRPVSGRYSAITYTYLYNTTHENPAAYFEGQELILKSPTERTGYTFEGWTPSVISAEMKGSQTIKANWTANSYSIVFYANGGVGTMPSLKTAYDVETNLTDCAFVRDGYVFTGWAISAEGEVIYRPGSKVLNLTAVAGGVVELYAHWVWAGPIDDVDGVQLWENGPIWAHCNVGASTPEECGYYFWWGDTVGYVRNANNDGWVASDGGGKTWRFDDSLAPSYGKSYDELVLMGYSDDSSSGLLNVTHDAAKQHCGSGWRMPTSSELHGLIDNCTTTWTKRNGVWGRLVTGTGNYTSKSIFLPAGGFGDGVELRNVDQEGYYWSSSPCAAYSEYSGISWYLDFGRYTSGGCYGHGRYFGQLVRPVSELIK